jgi:hypothetical protein
MVLFWTLYLSGSADLGQDDPLVSAFEAAFVLADTALGLSLVAAGWFLLRRDPRGTYLMVIAAAMALYLGLLDLAFYARIGLYDTVTGPAAFELALNALCIVGGFVCLRIGWKLWRRELLRSLARRRPQWLITPLISRHQNPHREPTGARAAGGGR